MLEEQALAYHELGNKNVIAGRRRNIDIQERRVCNMENEIVFPWGPWGFKMRIGPPYPQRVIKDE